MSNRKLIICCLLLCSAASALAAAPGPYSGNGPATANLWVDTNGGTCARQSTAGAYSDAAACSSMQAALTAAQAGDVIVIRDGAYGAQTLSSGGKASAVTFHAQTYDGGVTVSSLAINVDYVAVYGVIASGTGNSRGGFSFEGSHILLDGFRGSDLGGAWSGSPFTLRTDVTIQHCEFGGNDTALVSGEWDMIALGHVSYFNFLNNYIHDHYNHSGDNDCTNHNDMMSVHYEFGGDHINIDGNIFVNQPGCSSQIMSSGPLSNWSITNNYFASNLGSNLICWGQGTGSGYFRFWNNTVGAGPNEVNFGGLTGSPDVSFYGNIYLTSTDVYNGGNPPTTVDYNIYPTSGGSATGAHSKRCVPTWLNGAPSSSNSYDLRTAENDTCARNAGNPSNYAPTDYLGSIRTGTPDAGAYEYDGSPPPTGSLAIGAGSGTITIGGGSGTITIAP